MRLCTGPLEATLGHWPWADNIRAGTLTARKSKKKHAARDTGLCSVVHGCRECNRVGIARYAHTHKCINEYALGPRGGGAQLDARPSCDPGTIFPAHDHGWWCPPCTRQTGHTARVCRPFSARHRTPNTEQRTPDRLAGLCPAGFGVCTTPVVRGAQSGQGENVWPGQCQLANCPAVTGVTVQQFFTNEFYIGVAILQFSHLDSLYIHLCQLPLAGPRSGGACRPVLYAFVRPSFFFPACRYCADTVQMLCSASCCRAEWASPPRITLARLVYCVWCTSVGVRSAQLRNAHLRCCAVLCSAVRVLCECLAPC